MNRAFCAIPRGPARKAGTPTGTLALFKSFGRARRSPVGAEIRADSDFHFLFKFGAPVFP